MRVSGDDPAVRSLYGEALVRASSGVVTEEAHATFAAVVGDAPLETRARYYLALADYQAGKLERALAAWQSLATEATPDAPWRAVVVARIREVAGELDRDPVALVPDARIPDARGPDDGDLAAAQEMTPDQQQAMIRSMVDGLAARLQDSPHDVEGWLRLARSYTVLGEPDRAIDAYANANEQAPDRLDILESYAKAALAPIDEGAPLPPRVIDIMRDIEALAPDHPDALWFLGVAAAQDGSRRRCHRELGTTAGSHARRRRSPGVGRARNPGAKAKLIDALRLARQLLPSGVQGANHVTADRVHATDRDAARKQSMIETVSLQRLWYFGVA